MPAWVIIGTAIAAVLAVIVYVLMHDDGMVAGFVSGPNPVTVIVKEGFGGIIGLPAAFKKGDTIGEMRIIFPKSFKYVQLLALAKKVRAHVENNPDYSIIGASFVLSIVFSLFIYGKATDSEIRVEDTYSDVLTNFAASHQAGDAVPMIEEKMMERYRTHALPVYTLPSAADAARAIEEVRKHVAAATQ